MKKSQLYGHIFIYILTISITSFILIYGYNAVKGLRDSVDKASCLKFRNDMKNAVYTIMSDYGTVKRKDFELCSGYTKVCFVETYGQITNKNSPEINDLHELDPIIIDSIKDNAASNAFLLDNTVKDNFYAGNITVENDIFCVSAAGGRITIRLEGKGNNVEIGKWE